MYYTDEQRRQRHLEKYGTTPDFPRQHKYWKYQRNAVGDLAYPIAIRPSSMKQPPIIPIQPPIEPPANPNKSSLTGKQWLIIFGVGFVLAKWFSSQNKKKS